MINVEHLSRQFGRVAAIQDISFQVAKGEIVGFLGPNGAGKTTTMRILAGFLPPSSGRVEIAGMDVLRDSIGIRRRIGYMPESVPLYPEMRVKEYLKYRARLKGVQGRDVRRRLDHVVAACELGEVRSTVIGRLSKGFRQRVALADSLIHDPELLILDEPTIGLDPNQIRHIRSLIKGLARRHTVLLSSHILSEVEMICQRVLIINRGRIVTSDTTRNLVGLMKGNPRVTIEIRGPLDAIMAGLSQVPGVIQVSTEETGAWQRLQVECSPGSDLRPDIFSLAAEHHWTLRELTLEKQNLEDVFCRITHDEGAAETHPLGAGKP